MTATGTPTGLGPDIVGTTFAAVTSSWDARDCALYALGVGAGQDDPGAELQFTTDNAGTRPPAVLPTFAVLAGCSAAIPPLVDLMAGHADVRMMLHGEQGVEQVRPLPTAATVRTTSGVVAAWDKGNATVLETVSEIRDAASDEVYARTRQSMFFRGVGGWGGERGPSSRPQRPDRTPDHTLRATTRPDQALLYRLSGDRNPLHSDPAAARAAGFERPILHGLCTYGVVGRLLLARYAGSDPARFGALSGRLSSPVQPGSALTVLAWEGPGRVDFVVLGAGDAVAIDAGQFTYTD